MSPEAKWEDYRKVLRAECTSNYKHAMKVTDIGAKERWA